MIAGLKIVNSSILVEITGIEDLFGKTLVVLIIVSEFKLILDFWNFNANDFFYTKIKEVNFCPEQEKCVTYREKFKTAENFCSSIWDGSFIVENTDKCFSFDFEKSNPNKATAEYYANLVDLSN